MDEFKQSVVNSLSNTITPKYTSKQINVNSLEHYFSELDTTYFPDFVMKRIRTMKARRVMFFVNETECNLTLAIGKNTKFNIVFFVKFIRDCVCVIGNVFKKHLPKFDICLILCNDSKHLSVSKTITSENINSGLGYMSNDHPKIVVYRKEEICKVIVHEMLHIYKIHPFHYPSMIDTTLTRKYNVNHLIENKSLNICESYVEVLSIFINSIMYEITNNDTNAFKKEQTHQLYLVNQLNNYKPYNETTNVFAYVLLKYSLLLNLNQLLSDTKSSNYCINDTYPIIKYSDNIPHILPELKSKSFLTKVRLSKMDIFKIYLKIFQK